MDETYWFDTARLGMFIHWDHASQQGLELSWPLVGGVFAIQTGHVAVETYHRTAETFAPEDDWAPNLARLARQAGMRYAVFTTKHHNGYCMWPTAMTDHSITKSQPGRDLVREFVDAFRAEGLRVGFYYSLSDWHHPDYPAWTDEDSPYRWFKWRKSPPEVWERFRLDMFAQLRELLSGYGKIDEVWFDGGWERPPEEWDTAGIEALIRELQPNAIINDRLPGRGDFETPEQFVPSRPPEGRWETCLTMNRSWGYVPTDTDYKSTRDIIHALCEIAGRGGNLLLNVSPDGDGNLPSEQVERLEAVARWMDANAEAVVGTGPGFEPWQFYGPSTAREGRSYVHLLMRPYETVTVRGVPIKRVTGVTHLATGRELDFTTNCAIMDRMRNPDPQGELTITVPPELVDESATVLAIDISQTPGGA